MELTLQEKLKGLPEKPGVYLMKNAAGEIIYVGKAVVLKNRVRSYFHNCAGLAPKVRRMVSQIADLDYIITDSELEALILECNLIKKHRPKYNVRLKDDKHYPYLKVTWQEEYPRLVITRSLKKDGAQYFGPYASAGDVHQTLTLLHRIFPLRNCKQANLSEKGRACLNYHIKRCMAPCQGYVSQDDYRKMMKEVCLFLEGRGEKVLKDLRKQMEEATAHLNFERAAELRDQILSVERIVEKQKVISSAMEDQDVIAFARSEDDTCVQVFFIRGGKLIRKENFWLNGTGEMSEGELMSAFVKQYYNDAPFVPREILLQNEVDEANIISSWLSSKRGAHVYLKVPRKGEKRKLVEMVAENAAHLLEQMTARMRKQKEMTEGALEELAGVLGLKKAPYRIECYDISNIQGSEPVGSMVVFEGGKPANNEYRRFKIREVKGPNDFAMMQEVLWRRFRKGLQEKETFPVPGKKAKFAVWPDLIVVDGGKGQLSSACDVLRELGLSHLPIIGLAKEFEHIFRPGESEPVVLPHDSQALQLLQRIRDEAHRFAVTYHRQLRDKRTLHSELDEIPGIGPNRRRNLLRAFGSLDGIRRASIEEIAALPGMNRKIAQELLEHLK